MIYTDTANTDRHFKPTRVQTAGARPSHHPWRRAYARLLASRRRTAEREIAEIVRRWRIELPEGAPHARRIGSSPRRAA